MDHTFPLEAQFSVVNAFIVVVPRCLYWRSLVRVRATIRVFICLSLLDGLLRLHRQVTLLMPESTLIVIISQGGVLVTIRAWRLRAWSSLTPAMMEDLLGLRAYDLLEIAVGKAEEQMVVCSPFLLESVCC